jgi:uncharacterized membrane protein
MSVVVVVVAVIMRSAGDPVQAGRGIAGKVGQILALMAKEAGQADARETVHQVLTGAAVQTRQASAVVYIHCKHTQIAQW